MGKKKKSLEQHKLLSVAIVQYEHYMPKVSSSTHSTSDGGCQPPKLYDLGASIITHMLLFTDFIPLK